MHSSKNKDSSVSISELNCDMKSKFYFLFKIVEMINSEFGKHSFGESLLLRALVYLREFFTVNYPLGVSMLIPSAEIRLIEDPLI
jgi:hypothetical protein